MPASAIVRVIKKFPQHVRTSLPLLLMLLALLLVFYLRLSAPEISQSPFHKKIWPVETLVVSPTTLSPQLKLFGQVDAQEKTSLYSKIDGYISKIYVAEEDNVLKGDKLMEIESKDHLLRYQQQLAELATLQSELELLQVEHQLHKQLLTHEKELLAVLQSSNSRAEKLFKNRVDVITNLEESKAAMIRQSLRVKQQQIKIETYNARRNKMLARINKAQQAVNRAKVNLDFTVLKAPYNGKITDINTAIGDYTLRGATLLAMHNSESLILNVKLPKKEIKTLSIALKKGITIPAEVTALDGTVVSAKLIHLASVVKQDTHGIEGTFQFEKSDPNEFLFALGQYLKVTVSLPAVANSIQLPITALHANDIIYQVQENTLQPVKVKINGYIFDEDDDAQLIVTSEALNKHSEILVSPLHAAARGVQIKRRIGQPFPT